jgi:uncharacterized membrane protein
MSTDLNKSLKLKKSTASLLLMKLEQKQWLDHMLLDN